MSDETIEAAATCHHCDGTGRVLIERCAALVQGRRCKRWARNDPAFFAEYPDRAFTRGFCVFHGNLMVRQRWQLS